ncbi:MAG: bacillithiol biosynthesis cysteine-adding enzyme BshC, partial [Candidatus Aminicenantes bacterium]|nr:bacillithiol biosynthesis cysteine-adding enzyme BshC [Candidatus Aminicenantes bacterium]
AVLIEQNLAYGCGPRVLENIETLKRDEACAVVTGQQAGLFSGPLYTIYKALTAVKLAERLNRTGSGKFVPVFWVASDDHDLAEVDHVDLLDKDNRPARIRCPMPSPEAKTPVSRLALPPEIEGNLRELAELTPETEFKPDILAALSGIYEPGRGWVEAFGQWMSRLFASRGLVFIDASDPRLKGLGGWVFSREIAGESAATAPAMAASQRLGEAGYGVQVRLHPGLLHLFYAERERRSIEWEGRAFKIHDPAETWSKDDLLALAGAKPFLFSPNVLLRPLYQDAILPTVAYIGGPAEIAYFGQMKGVYERFGLPMPVIYPRKSATVVEHKIGRVLEKFDLDVQDFWNGAEAVVRRVGEGGIPESLSARLRRAAALVEEDFESLAGEVAAFEPTLKESAHLARGRMLQQLEFLERKIVQASKKREGVAVGQVRKAADHLYPGGRFQERVFNIVPYLIKYGPSFIDDLDEALDLDAHGHQILRRRS